MDLFRYYSISFEIILGFAMHIVQKYSWDMLLWILYLVYVHILSFHVLFKNKCVECEVIVIKCGQCGLCGQKLKENIVDTLQK